MTSSVKEKKQPAVHKAAAAALGKDSIAAGSTGVGKKDVAGTAAKVRAPAAGASKPAAAARRKAAATAGTKAAATPRKAPASSPVTPAKAGKPASAATAAPAKTVAPAAPAKAAPAKSAPAKSAPAKSAALAKKPVVVRATAAKAKLNKRSAETIAKILETTGEIILQSGADRISILDVCEQAGISRGTFYRYYSSQEELLDAFSRHKRDQFHATLLAVTSGIDDPDERFQAVVGFIDNYLENSRARRLLLVAPEYALRWFQRIFNDSVHRFQDILSISFDAWEVRRGITIDRELVCELLVRFILSNVLVPAGAERRDLMRRIERFVVMLLSGRVARR
jgi:AcrR family transcriptional regulator